MNHQVMAEQSGAEKGARPKRLVALTSFLNLYALVGIAFYGPPYFYDFMVSEFGWTREQVTSGNTYGKTLVLPLFGFAEAHCLIKSCSLAGSKDLAARRWGSLIWGSDWAERLQ